MARQHERLNVILFLWHLERRDYGAGTTEAANKWATATSREKDAQMVSTGRATPGGRWVEEEHHTSYSLVPAFIVQDRPFIVLYQRTFTHWTARNDHALRTESGGHYEAVVKRTRNAAGEAQYTGVFGLGGDTDVEYAQCLVLAQRYMATINQQAASQRMARNYDKKASVHQFSLLDAVGVRVSGKNPRKGNTRHILPGLVLGIHSHKVGTANAVTHKLYTVWCAHGVLSQPIKVDKLVALSANNFPELLQFRDVTLTDDERLSPDDDGWQSPLLNTARTIPKVTLEAAWKAEQATYKQRPVDPNSGQRKFAPRTAAVAADTALAVARADKRRGTSLATLSNQAAPAAARTQGSYITMILRENASSYYVRWSQPEGNPTESYVGRRWMDKLAEYKDTVIRWREQQARQQQQAELSGSDTSEDSGREQDESAAGSEGEQEDGTDMPSDAELEADAEPNNDDPTESVDELSSSDMDAE